MAKGNFLRVKLRGTKERTDLVKCSACSRWMKPGEVNLHWAVQHREGSESRVPFASVPKS